MKPILKRLGFVPMSQFIEERLNLRLDCSDIFIKSKHKFPDLSTRKSMSNSDILSYALETCGERNQLCNGYCKATKRWYSTNTSRNLLKSKKWAEIFDGLGCGYSIFILTRCSVVERVDRSLVFVCGDFGENIERKQAKAAVDREKLFYGRDELTQISLESVIEEVLVPCVRDNDEIVGRMAKIFGKFSKLPVKSLFKSFFSRRECRSEDKVKAGNQTVGTSKNDTNDGDDVRFQHNTSTNGSSAIRGNDESIIGYEIDPESIANFLFMISKKFLRPALGLDDFKILKGKLVLLLKRNILETVSREELIKYLRISRLKLFRGVKNLSFSNKIDVAGNFLLFIFKRIYLNILGFFFYSTSSSFSKTKILYFTRIEWNRKVSQFISKHLEQFSKVKNSSHFATLRCIPKENGFRVVSNCSKAGSHASKMKIKRVDKNRRAQCKVNECPETCLAHSKSLLLSLEKVRHRYSEISSIFEDGCSDVKVSEEPLQRSFERPASSGLRCVSVSQDSTSRECGARSQNEYVTRYEPGSKRNSEFQKCARLGCTYEAKHNSSTHSRPKTCIDIKNLPGRDLSEGECISSRESVAQSKTPRSTLLSINSLVASIHPILKRETQGNIGYSLMDHRDVKERLFAFLKSANRRLYMMKVDLDRCFDNIPQKDLVSVLNRLFKRDEYHFQEFVLLKENATESKVEIKYVRKAPDVLYPINMAEGHLDNIETCEFDGNFIIKENRTKIFNRSEILSRVKNIVENTTIYYQNAYYRSSKGIPQGCCISPILCAVYYGHLDGEFKHLDGFISRFVDDFLIITPQIEVIRNFFKIARGLREKGFVINRSKICANFDVEAVLESSDMTPKEPMEDSVKFTANCIEWCGMKIYDSGTALKGILSDKYFRYSVYLAGPNVGRKIFLKIKKSLEARCTLLYINKLNTKSGENIFDAFYSVGRKLKILILRADFINSNFVGKILDWCVERVRTIAKKRRILLDDWKIDSIAKKAFEKCGVLEIKKKPFDR